MPTPVSALNRLASAARRRTLPILLGVGLGLGRSLADAPPAEQLLPADTIAVFSVRDWEKSSAFYGDGPYGRLWADPSLKPFRDKIVAKMDKDLLGPIEKELGVKLAEYGKLLRGQVTLAITPPTPGTDQKFGCLLLIDTKDNGDLLKSSLADLKKKWVASGRTLKSEKIRDAEFSTLALTRDDWDKLMGKIFPGGKEEPAPAAAEEKSKSKFEITFGQSNSLLVVGEDSKTIEKVLSRQAGGLVAPLAEQAAFQKNQAALFNDALVLGWVNFKPVYSGILANFAATEKAKSGAAGGENPFELKPEKLLSALGLSGLSTLAFKTSGNAEGSFLEVFLGVPEAARQGIFKVLSPEKNDSSPPPFVPADAVEFQRWRLDSKKVWSTVEATLTTINPAIAGFVILQLESAGKAKDPDFDLRKSLLNNMGADLVTYAKVPKVGKNGVLEEAPSITLLASPNPEDFINAIKILAVLLPPPLGTTPLREREFLGRKIYSLTTALEDEDSKAPARTLSFANSGGYIAFSADKAILEEYVRGGDTAAKTLRETPGLNEAAQKVGGYSNGLFGFENQSETMRATLEAAKKSSPDSEPGMLSGAIGARMGTDEAQKALKEWLDFSLLPSFDRISKYFGLSVYAGSSTPDGLSLKAYAPTPPQMRK